MKLYTWLDVESLIQSKQMPDEIQKIEIFADGVEVFCKSKNKHEIQKIFQSWFKNWYDANENVIHLEKARDIPKSLPVFFQEKLPDYLITTKKELEPLFGELSFFSEELKGKELKLPASNEKDPCIMAFYSFKGGVGRTLHLVAALKNLLTQNAGNQPSILVVDADLEAPGLTWWARDKSEQPELSYLDFLALANYDLTEQYKHTIDLTAKVLKETLFSINNFRCYFLPAFRTIQQMLRFPVKPEHLIQNPECNWIIGDLLFRLGRELQVDYILVDLRAGFSELAAPVLFDPRILRFICSTYAKQSVEGTKIVLEQLTKIASLLPELPEDAQDAFFDPVVLFTMVPENMKDNEKFTAIQQELMVAYPDYPGDVGDAVPSRLKIVVTDFAQELLYIEDANQAWDKLSGTSVDKKINILLKELPLKKDSEIELDGLKPEQSITKDLSNLVDFCEELEYAETGKGEAYLPIRAIVNLGQQFASKMPLAVVIGSKGAGKTYLYLQLIRLGSWREFLKKISPDPTVENPTADIVIFPFLESVNLKDNARKMTVDRRAELWRQMNNGCSKWNQNMLTDKIKQYLKENTDWSDVEWRRCWFHLIGKALGINMPVENKQISVEDIQANLKEQNLRVLVVIDGLEDIFDDIKTNVVQQKALKGILDTVEYLREYREMYLGVICFARRDMIRTVIKQNTGQYEQRYKPFELNWDFTEALRLVLWAGKQANVISIDDKIDDKKIDYASKEKLKEKLVPFWGRKLGKSNSREANTANWVLAALSDFNGQLQARDMIRFIKYAAENSQKNINYQDRLLQPAGIRQALEPCSIKKIKEIKNEFSDISNIFNNFETWEESKRRVPFTADTAKKIGLSEEAIKQLLSLGILHKSDDRYYMPEIFRYGLGFSMDKGARPAVLFFKKKFL